MPAQGSEANMLDGRKRARTSERLLVQVFSSEEPFVREMCPTQNISSLGARLLTERPWTPDSRVLLDCRGGNLWARVVYCRALRPKTFAVGLEFFARTGELVIKKK